MVEIMSLSCQALTTHQTLYIQANGVFCRLDAFLRKLHLWF